MGFKLPAWTLLVILVLTLPPLFTRGQRARILLLRPFGPAPMSRALKRVVRRHLGTLGAVFTLSDRNYQPSMTLDALKLIGVLRHVFAPLVRPSIRIAAVWNDASYRQLARVVGRNLWLDVQSAYAGGQAFNIASANGWWKNCIDLLLHSTDFVIMDISRVQQGSAWEIVRLVRREALDRTIFIAHENYSDHAMEAIEKYLPEGAKPELLLFRESGDFVNPAAFEAAVERALQKALASPRSE